MTNVKVTVTLSYKGVKFSATERKVRLTEDDVQISAAGLAYSLVEDVWGEVSDDDE